MNHAGRLTVAILANCQGDVLARLLMSSPAFAARCHIVPIPYVFVIPGLPPAERARIRTALIDADVLLYQRVSSSAGEFSSDALLGERSPGSRALGIPNLYFTGYHPEIAYFKIGESRITDLLSEYNDINLLRDVAAGRPVEDGVNRILDPDAYPPGIVHDNASASIAELERRERGLSVSSADLIAATWRDRQLFHSFNHPTNEMMALIADRVLDALELGGTCDARAAGSGLSAHSPPVYAAVARNIGIPASLPVVHGITLPVAEYVRRWQRALTARHRSAAQSILDEFAREGTPAQRFCAVGSLATASAHRTFAEVERIERLVVDYHACVQQFPAATDARPRLPTVIGIGTGRCGTTSIWEWLRAHPDVYMSPVKEINFFRRVSDPGGAIGEYARYFAGAGTQKHIGEISPAYIGSLASLEAIARTTPGVRILVTLRDPVERFISIFYHLHVFHQRNDLIPFIHEGIAGLRAGFDPLMASPAQAVDPAVLVGRSLYARPLRRIFELFGKDRTLVLFLEDLQRDPRAYMQRLAGFLDIPCLDRDLPRANSLRQALPEAAILAEARALLAGFLAPDVAELRQVVPVLPESFPR